MDINKTWSKLNTQERQEISRLLASPVYPDILSDTFPLQRQFIQDKSKLKALFCTRRSAKSYTAGLYLVKTALDRPATSSVYIGLTRDTAKRIVWTDVFKAILGKYKIRCRFNETELTITFPNGSIIYILGVDDSEAEKDKLLGKKYALAVIDEAASYSIDLHNLVYKVLKPAMSDLGGTICMIGTPDNKKDGIFYNLTSDIQVNPPSVKEANGWKVWGWTAHDNIYMRDAWQATINDLQASDPLVHEQPWYQQHYLARWVVEDSNKIYRYSHIRNSWDGVLPDYGYKEWNYVLGIDLGFSDATALVLLAYHENDKHTYIIKSEKWKGLTITDTADKIRIYMSSYPINYFIVDGANKQAVEEIVRHHGIPLEAADKTDKASFIRIMNSDFVSGKIKMFEPGNAPLVEEYDKAIWNKRHLERGIYKEDTSYHPDASDAALYAYRFCYSYLATPPSRDQMFKTDLEREKHEMDQYFNQQKADLDELTWGNEHIFAD
jgi:phage terminase large subunit